MNSSSKRTFIDNANHCQLIYPGDVRIALLASITAVVAFIEVLGHVMHYRYSCFPVMIDFILLVMPGAAYSNLTGKRYPNRPS